MLTLARLQVRQAAVMVENAHQAELGQGRRVHTTGRRKDRGGHAHVIAHALDKLADAGAGRLHPAHVGGNIRQVFPVRMVKIEENVRRRQQLTPALLLFCAARYRRARVVGRIARRAQQVGFVDDPQPRIDLANLRDIFFFEIAGNQERIDAITVRHKFAVLSWHYSG